MKFLLSVYAAICFLGPSVNSEECNPLQHRGFMLDTARHFFPVEWIKRILGYMQDAKMNVFHWHLTDDQGFNIQFDYDKGKLMRENFNGGFYTHKDIMDVIADAKEKGIQVIPEIDTPSHSLPFYNTYPELMMPLEWDHREFNIAEKAPQIQTVLQRLFKEIYPMFTSEYVHFGHDEAFANRKSEIETSLEFVKDIAKNLTEKWVKQPRYPIIWNDPITFHKVNVDKDLFTVQVWTDMDKLREMTQYVYHPVAIIFAAGKPQTPKESKWDKLTDGDEIEVMDMGPDEVSLEFQGEKEVYKQKKMIINGWTGKVKEGAGAAYASLPDCTFLGRSKTGSLLILFRGCKNYHGGNLQKHGVNFDLNLKPKEKGAKGRKAGVKKSKQSTKGSLINYVTLARAVQSLSDKSPKVNEAYAKWLKKTEGKDTTTRQLRSAEQHKVRIQFIGDSRFFWALEGDSVRIGEHLEIILKLFKAGMEQLPGLVVDMATPAYFTNTIGKPWMENPSSIGDEAYIREMSESAVNTFFNDAPIDVYMYITGWDDGTSQVGVASAIGDTCTGPIGSLNEMGKNGAPGSVSDAISIADIAAHEAGHNLGLYHDFEAVSSRTPESTCKGSAKGQMAYNALDWMKEQLDWGNPVWSACSINDWARFTAYLKTTYNCLTDPLSGVKSFTADGGWTDTYDLRSCDLVCNDLGTEAVKTGTIEGKPSHVCLTTVANKDNQWVERPGFQLGTYYDDQHCYVETDGEPRKQPSKRCLCAQQTVVDEKKFDWVDRSTYPTCGEACWRLGFDDPIMTPGNGLTPYPVCSTNMEVTGMPEGGQRAGYESSHHPSLCSTASYLDYSGKVSTDKMKCLCKKKELLF